MARQVRERGKRQSAEQQRIAHLLQFPFSRLGQKRFEQRCLLRFRQRLRHIAARKLIRTTDQPFCVLRRGKDRDRRVRREQLYWPRAESVRLTISFRLSDSQKRQLLLTLRKQALTKRAQLRNAAAAPVGQLVHHMHKLPRVHGAEKIAAEAVWQDKPCVLLRDASCLQCIINAEKGFDRIFKYCLLRVVREIRRNKSGPGKIDIPP